MSTTATPWPQVIVFPGLGPCFYKKGEFREPRKGEFYAGGATLTVFHARQDMDSLFRVVIPTHFAEQEQVWRRGAPIEQPKPYEPQRSQWL